MNGERATEGAMVLDLRIAAVRMSAYLRALETAIQGAGLPYGYAITVWGTGSALVGQKGVPAVPSIFLFAAGAATAYGGLKLLLAWNMGGEAEKRRLCCFRG